MGEVKGGGGDGGGGVTDGRGKGAGVGRVVGSSPGTTSYSSVSPQVVGFFLTIKHFQIKELKMSSL